MAKRKNKTKESNNKSILFGIAILFITILYSTNKIIVAVEENSKVKIDQIEKVVEKVVTEKLEKKQCNDLILHGSYKNILFSSIKDDNVMLLKRLIDCGADINLTEADGNSALIQASFTGKTEIVKILIDAGADINYQNNNGKTALDYSKDKNYSEITEVLKQAGAK